MLIVDVTDKFYRSKMKARISHKKQCMHGDSPENAKKSFHILFQVPELVWRPLDKSALQTKVSVQGKK